MYSFDLAIFMIGVCMYANTAMDGIPLLTLILASIIMNLNLNDIHTLNYYTAALYYTFALTSLVVLVVPCTYLRIAVCVGH